MKKLIPYTATLLVCAFVLVGSAGGARYTPAGAQDLQQVIANLEQVKSDLVQVKSEHDTLKETVQRQFVESPPNVPVGTILPYAGPVDADHPLPEGWLLCDGSSVSSATYGELWRKLRVAEGPGFRGAWGGDGNPNFNLPDLAGRFLRGVDKDKTGQASNPARDPDRGEDKRLASRAGGNTGNNVGSVQGDAFRSHEHEINDPKHSHGFTGYRTEGAGGPGQAYPTNSNDFGTTRDSTGITIKPRGGNETRPVNAYVYWIVRAK